MDDWRHASPTKSCLPKARLGRVVVTVLAQASHAYRRLATVGAKRST